MLANNESPCTVNSFVSPRSRVSSYNCRLTTHQCWRFCNAATLVRRHMVQATIVNEYSRPILANDPKLNEPVIHPLAMANALALILTVLHGLPGPKLPPQYTVFARSKLTD